MSTEPNAGRDEGARHTHEQSEQLIVELRTALRDCVMLIRAADTGAIKGGALCDLLIFKDAVALLNKAGTA